MSTRMVGGLFAAALLAGCVDMVPPGTIRAGLVADARVNAERGGPGVPTQVRLYMLTTGAKFSGSDYFQLIDHEKDALGGTLVSREEVIMHPGETKSLDLKVGPEVRFVGVAVSYKAIDQSTWRVVMAVPANGRLSVGLTLDRVTLKAGG